MKYAIKYFGSMFGACGLFAIGLLIGRDGISLSYALIGFIFINILGLTVFMKEK